jgi:hypothetical protein
MLFMAGIIHSSTIRTHTESFPVSLECGEIFKTENILALHMKPTSVQKMVTLHIFVWHALSPVIIYQTIGNLMKGCMLLWPCFTSSVNTSVHK